MINSTSNKKVKRSLDPVLEAEIKNYIKNKEEKYLSEFASKSAVSIKLK